MSLTCDTTNTYRYYLRRSIPAPLVSYIHFGMFLIWPFYIRNSTVFDIWLVLDARAHSQRVVCARSFGNEYESRVYLFSYAHSRWFAWQHLRYCTIPPYLGIIVAISSYTPYYEWQRKRSLKRSRLYATSIIGSIIKTAVAFSILVAARRLLSRSVIPWCQIELV